MLCMNIDFKIQYVRKDGAIAKKQKNKPVVDIKYFPLFVPQWGVLNIAASEWTWNIKNI